MRQVPRNRPKVEPNLIDRIVHYFDPIAGAKRLHARTICAMAGGYTGARKDRRATASWKPGKNDADSDILPDLETLRERSRSLIRNVPLAAGAIHTKVTNVVGTGLRLQSSIDWEFLGMSEEQADEWERNTEREFRLWAKSTHCDAERTLNFHGLQELVFRQALENGDVFCLLPFKAYKGCPYELKIQVIEADRVCNADNERNSPQLAGGVRKDAYGAPVEYHFLKHHPGAIYGQTPEWVKVRAFGSQTGRRNVLHLFYKTRPGQSRGVPDLAPVIEAFKQLGDYTEAELMAAVVSGLFTVFIKSEGGESLAPFEPTSETGGSASDKDYKLGYGSILDLMPGESIEAPNPGRPNQAFDPFVMAVLRQIGVALELPFEILVKHFTASYSAARAAMVEAWKFFMKRRAWLADNFCQPVYEEWLTEAVALGRISAPGFLSGDPAIRAAYLGAEWIGPARGQIDEWKEIQAAEKRVDLGISTLEDETAGYSGGDWEAKHRQRAKEMRLRKEAGLVEQPAQQNTTSEDPPANEDLPENA